MKLFQKLFRKKSALANNAASCDIAALLSLVASETDNSVIITDAHERIEYVNRGFTKMTGYSFDEALGKKPGDFLQGKLTDADTKREIKGALDAGKPVNTEILNYHKNGNSYWVSLVINPVFGAHGELEHYISIQTNVTTARQKAQDLSMQFAALGRAQTMIEFDMNGIIVNANENFLTLFGYTLPEIKGKHHRIFVESVYAESAEYQQFWDNIKAGHYMAQEFKRIGKNGKEIWIQGSYNPILDITGNPTKVVKFATDMTQRKKEEQTLNVSEERLQLAVNGSADGLWDWNVVTGEVYFSPRFMALTGHAPEELPHTIDTWIELMHPDDREPTNQVVQKYFNERGNYGVEYRLRHKDGHYVWCHARGQAIWNDKDEAIRMTGFTLDISEQKAAQKENRDLKNAMELAVEGSAKLDPSGRYTYVNESYASMTGYKPDEMVGREWPMTVHLDDQPFMIGEYERMLKVGKVAPEARGVRKDGSVFHKQLTMISDYDESGAFIGHYCFMKDISERKHAEEQLSESQKLLALAIETIPDFLFVKDADFKIVQANKKFLSLYPESMRDRVIGTSTIEHYTPEQREVFLEKDKEAFAKGVVEYEERIHFPNGEDRTLQTTKVRFYDAKGVPFILGIGRDITERKEAENARRKLMDHLTESNTELERFAYVASHDMQEPLRMIANFSELLGKEYKDKLDAESNEYIHIITDAAIRMQHMVDDLLEYARVGNSETRMVTVNAVQELNHVLDNLRMPINESGAVVTFDDLPDVVCNPVQFMRVLQNLIGNGIKYNKGDGKPTVHVSVKDLGNEWCFSVLDNGIGIDMKYATNVFEPFKRLQTWEDYKGSGIGLSVCKKIVENHGGKIWLESKPDHGTTFYFTLPKIGIPPNFKG